MHTDFGGYRSSQTLATEAELAARSSSEVFAWLERRAHAHEVYATHVFDREGDEQLEQSLLNRTERLVDLALARFAFSREVCVALYQRNEPILRVAVLSNRVWPRSDHRDVVTTLASALELEEPAFVQQLTDDEIVALCSNPCTSVRILLEALTEAGRWATPPPDRRPFVYLALARNERISWAPGRNSIDEHGPDEVDLLQAIWSLAESTTPSPESNGLTGLLSQAFPQAKLNDALASAARWQAVDDDDWSVATELSRFALAEQRKLSARLRLVAKERLREIAGPFDPEEDPSEWLMLRLPSLAQGLLEELELWQSYSTRRELLQLAKHADEQQEDSGSTALFQERRRAMRAAYPQWFLDEPPEPAPVSHEVILRTQLTELATALGNRLAETERLIYYVLALSVVIAIRVVFM